MGGGDRFSALDLGCGGASCNPRERMGVSWRDNHLARHLCGFACAHLRGWGPVAGVSPDAGRQSSIGADHRSDASGRTDYGDWGARHRGHPERPGYTSQTTGIAMAVGLAITSYTVLDKVTLRYIPAVALNDASNLANLLALSWGAARSGVIRTEWIRHWRTIIMGGILSPGGYLLFLLALRLAPVAQLAPMREIGTVFGTVLGIGVLKERQGSRRLAAAGLIAAGVMTLGMWGR